uniref:Uncharacterized protein n=1 Tax=viral metagenome TaxID=1070528 RepID=A0A6M3XQ66_9ZZZZ
MYSGIRKAAIYDPATGTIVQLNAIATEGEIKIREPLEVEDGSGGAKYAGDHSVLEITAYDSSGFSQLETWMEAETELRAVTYGVDDHILWYESVPITVKKNYGSATGGRNSFTVRLEKKGGTHSIYCGNNILWLVKNWIDANTDGKADNYSFFQDANVTLTFSNSLYRQTITNYDTANDFEMFVEIIYPIANADLKFFNNVVSNTAGASTIKILEQTFADATIATTSSTTLTDVLSVDTVATQYKFKVYLIDAGEYDLTKATVLGVPYLGVKTSGTIKY